jgi:hypothetical protein
VRLRERKCERERDLDGSSRARESGRNKVRARDKDRMKGGYLFGLNVHP